MITARDSLLINSKVGQRIVFGAKQKQSKPRDAREICERSHEPGRSNWPERLRLTLITEKTLDSEFAKKSNGATDAEFASAGIMNPHVHVTTTATM